MTLAEIIEEGRRLLTDANRHTDGDLKCGRQAIRLLPGLLEAAAKAVEWRDAESEWERVEEEHERTCAYQNCDFRGCPHVEVWAVRDAVAVKRAAFDAAAQEPAPKPFQTMTRDEALAAGVPIHPDAIGVKLYSGAQVFDAPAPVSNAPAGLSYLPRRMPVADEGHE
jgi:hypothetical protein